MAFVNRFVKTQIDSWSFSRWSNYDHCPYHAKLTILDKLKEPKGKALERGANIHDQASAYLNGTAPRVPKDLANRAEEFKRLRKARAMMGKPNASQVVVEDTWAFTKTWASTTWNDWNNCWVRIKLDVAELAGDVLEITDWKTGRYRPNNLGDYILQLRLYGLGGLLSFLPLVPGLKVRPRLVYLDEDVIHDTAADGTKMEFTAADLKPLKKEWELRVKPMMNDKKFAPKPNAMCKLCHFRKSNGGPCQYD